MPGYRCIHTALGSGDFHSPIDSYAICQVSIIHPNPPALVTVVGTGDADLIPTDGGFVTILNEYAEVLNKGEAFSVQPDGRVLMNKSGTVKITAYADMAHSVNNSTVGAVFSIERTGSTVYSARTVHAKMPNSGDIGNVSGTGAFDAVAGDLIGIALASNLSGDVDVKSASTVLEFLGDY